MTNDELNIVSKQILDASITVHKEMGPGLLESIYEICLIKELKSRGLFVQNQVYVPLVYKGEMLSKDFRIDVFVENEIIIEIKAVDLILPVHKAQMISYLKLADKNLGFLINFNVAIMKEGFHRYGNNFS